MRQLYLILFISLNFYQCSIKPEIPTGSLLLEMIDLDRLVDFPDPHYTLKQFSSYHRKSVSPGEPGWFANADRSQFILTENNNVRREFVLLDAEGPEAVARFWVTVALYEGNGILRIYLDHKSELEPKLAGKRAIKQIQLNINGKNVAQALRSTVIEMEFDGNRTVWCPLGDFFVTGYKISPYET